MAKSHLIRNVILTIVFTMVLVGGGVLLFSNLIKQEMITSNFVKPEWARLECAPSDAYEGQFISRLNQQRFYKCDGFTEECRLKIEHTEQGPFVLNLRTDYRTCNLDGTSCSSWISFKLDDGEFSNLPNIPIGKMYEFIEDGIDEIGYEHAKVTLDWKPWKLYRFVGGSKWIVNSQNCDITTGITDKIRSEDIVSKLQRQGGEGDKWINYVNDWNYGPPINVFTHNSFGEVYCTAGQIFDIVELQMADGSLRKVDPQYTKTLPNGEWFSGLGNKLGNVECCPNEPNCNDNFEYVPEPPEKDCVSDIQCFNAGGPVPKTGTTYVVWQCINDICIESAPITVECTTNAQCPSGEICDLSTTNYGKCIKQIAEHYCGDGVCDSTENSLNCPRDCGPETLDCNWWEKEKESCGLNPLCWIGITKPERKCVIAGWVYLVIASILLFIIILMIILLSGGRRVSQAPVIVIRK